MKSTIGGRKSASGFTLLELMITVAVVAILATIAYASYQDQIIKSRRAAGATCLQERAQFMERFYTTNLSYLSSAGAAPNIGQCDNEVSPFYQVGLQREQPLGALYCKRCHKARRQPRTRSAGP